MMSARYHFIFTVVPEQFQKPAALNAQQTLARCWANVDLMLVQRHRRWPSIKSTLAQCLVFAGRTIWPAKQRADLVARQVQRQHKSRPLHHSVPMLYQRWTNGVDFDPPLEEQWHKAFFAAVEFTDPGFAEFYRTCWGFELDRRVWE